MEWKHKLDIRHLLTTDEDPSSETMVDVVSKISTEVGKLPMRDAAQPILKEMSEAAKIGSLTWFNAALDNLWDLCNEYKVWIPF